jgi:DNA replication protein DnaC
MAVTQALSSMSDKSVQIEGNRPRRKITKVDFRRINLGKSYWRCSIDGIQYEEVRKAVSTYARRIVAMISQGNGLVIGGERGVGKTGAAAVLIKEAVRRGYTAYFVTHAELRELQFKDAVFGDGKDGVTVNQKILSAEILFLDGFDDSFIVDKVFGPIHLERLVSRRNSNGLTTILTTRVIKEISKQKDLYDTVRQTMLPMVIRGRNLRDDAEEKLRAGMLEG